MIKAEIEICKFAEPILIGEEDEQWNTQRNSYSLPL